MRAMVLDKPVFLSQASSPLRLADVPMPVPMADELLVRVSACGVCHTELDEIEGRLQTKLPVILGHEVVGTVESSSPANDRFAAGARVGVGWIHDSSGDVDENLSPKFRATGCDVDGGYAEFMTVPTSYAVPIPDSLSDLEAAPLMCAGAIGYRALRLTNLQDGQPLGLMGFGASAHLVLQVAKQMIPSSAVYVFDRKAEVRDFAIGLGADWAGAIEDEPPHRPRAIIDTTPVWYPVVQALKQLCPGGRLVINAIRKEDADKQSLLELSYHDHLWMEREIKTVANLTYRDIAEFLPLAAAIPLRPEVTSYPLEAANEALQDLRRGGIKGAKVLTI